MATTEVAAGGPQVVQFEVGDVVQLRSGGPAMTVQGVNKDEPFGVETCWFPADESYPATGSFASATLRLIVTAVPEVFDPQTMPPAPGPTYA